MKRASDYETTHACKRREPLEGQLQLPPGFRFYPSDEELVVHYLCKRASSQPCFSTPIIAELDLYKFDPWELPGKALFGEKEWYFFSPRDRKYPNGSRPNRAAGSGYWKATGTDKPVLSCLQGDGSKKKVGVKKALVFYRGRPPKGDKTNWIMHEYRLADSAAKAARRKGSIRLDDWVLCRIYNKLPSTARLAMQKDDEEQHEFERAHHSNPKALEENELKVGMRCTTTPFLEEIPPKATNFSFFDNHVPSHQTEAPNAFKLTTQPSRTETTLSEGPFIKPPHAPGSLGIKDPYRTSTGFDQSSLTSSNYSNYVVEPTIPKMHRPSNTPNTLGQQFSHPHMIPTTRKPDTIFNDTFLKALSIPNPIGTTHDSPISSSVDEEQGQPLENLQGQITNKNRGEPMTSFSFDVLPSLFGQVDLRFSF